jgi:hypothetical protein
VPALSPSDLIEQLLLAHLNASDETIFGDAFFEPIAKIASGGVVSPAAGIDFAVETEARYSAIAMKSGPNIYNASQKRRQSDEFNAIRARLHGLKKEFDPVLGHAYGRTSRRLTSRTTFRNYRDSAGQSFWTEVTGDPDFFLKLIRLMGEEPARRREEFLVAWSALVNRLTLEFIQDFCFEDGRINWEKLVSFVSADKPPRMAPLHRRRASGDS